MAEQAKAMADQAAANETEHQAFRENIQVLLAELPASGNDSRSASLPGIVWSGKGSSLGQHLIYLRSVEETLRLTPRPVKDQDNTLPVNVWDRQGGDRTSQDFDAFVALLLSSSQ